MNEKQIFIHQLKKKLANLPEKERKKSLAFYSEMIDDAMEDGMSEAEAVKSLGDVNDIARDILSEAPFSSIVKGETQKLKNKCKNSPAFTVLLIVGSPVWLPLLLAAAICVCAVAFSAIAVFASLFISAIAVVVAGIVWVGYSVYFFLTGTHARRAVRLRRGIGGSGRRSAVSASLEKDVRAFRQVYGKML